PQTRIYESIICYRHFEKVDPSKIKLGRDVIGPGAIGGVEEMLCKADDIQNELAELNGMMQLFDGFATLVLAVPFGWAADRFGRWPLVFMNLIQYALRAAWTQLVAWNWQTFNVNTMWFASAMSVLGGGPSVVSALLFVVVADITSEAERTATFLRIGATVMSASLLMPPLASWLMQRNPWIPSLCGTALMIIAIPLWLFIPETLNYGHYRAKISTSTIAPRSPGSLDSTPTQPAADTNYSTFLIHKAQSIALFLIKDWRVPALITPFVVHNLIATINKILLQFISKRYNITMSAGILVLTIRNGVTVLLLFVIFPYLSTVLVQAYPLSESKKDLYLARASQILVAAGWLGVAASPTVFFVTISLAGTSFVPCAALLIRSFIASLVPAHQIAEVYSIISVVDTIGTMAGAPLLAGLFKLGFKLGGAWI
ncbi:major facilitator superfamily domain-containing protein, partial [Pyrenochaeta sp. MPI-SDFR-AT-0127]